VPLVFPTKVKREIHEDQVRLGYMGPGDSKLLCGPTKRYEESIDVIAKRKRRLEKREAERQKQNQRHKLAFSSSDLLDCKLSLN
jgi:hypothetical protein